MDNVHYLSAQSLENIKNELDVLKNKTIPDIAKRIDEAKQQGDLSENAEYHQAREDMSWAQSKLSELESIVQNAHVIKKSNDNNVVSLGSTVVIKTKTGTKKYTIVGPQEIDPSKGLISNESPLGQAFLGHSIGDKVQISTPSGSQAYEITAIE